MDPFISIFYLSSFYAISYHTSYSFQWKPAVVWLMTSGYTGLQKFFKGASTTHPGGQEKDHKLQDSVFSDFHSIFIFKHVWFPAFSVVMAARLHVHSSHFPLPCRGAVERESKMLYLFTFFR